MFNEIMSWSMNCNTYTNPYTTAAGNFDNYARTVSSDFETLRVSINILGQQLNLQGEQLENLKEWVEGFAKWVEQQHPGTLQDYATHLAVTQRIMDAIKD